MSNKRFTFIKSGKKFIKLYFDDVLLIKGLGNYVEIFTEHKKHIYYKSLKELIENLPEDFMRVHNSYIVNMANIDGVSDNQVLIKKHKIPVAKTYRQCLADSIEKLLL